MQVSISMVFPIGRELDCIFMTILFDIIMIVDTENNFRIIGKYYFYMSGTSIPQGTVILDKEKYGHS